MFFLKEFRVNIGLKFENAFFGTVGSIINTEITLAVSERRVFLKGAVGNVQSLVRIFTLDLNKSAVL